MYSPTVIGVDPGIVHTGVVMLDFDVEQRRLKVDHRLVDGTDAAAALEAVKEMTGRDRFNIHTLDTFI